jgi:hypothetical protein
MQKACLLDKCGDITSNLAIAAFLSQLHFTLVMLPFLSIWFLLLTVLINNLWINVKIESDIGLVCQWQIFSFHYYFSRSVIISILLLVVAWLISSIVFNWDGLPSVDGRGKVKLSRASLVRYWRKNGSTMRQNISYS